MAVMIWRVMQSSANERKLDVLVDPVVPDRLVEADHPLLLEVLGVAAGEEVARGAQADEGRVAPDDLCLARAVPDRARSTRWRSSGFTLSLYDSLRCGRCHENTCSCPSKLALTLGRLPAPIQRSDLNLYLSNDLPNIARGHAERKCAEAHLHAVERTGVRAGGERTERRRWRAASYKQQRRGGRALSEPIAPCNGMPTRHRSLAHARPHALALRADHEHGAVGQVERVGRRAPRPRRRRTSRDRRACLREQLREVRHIAIGRCSTAPADALATAGRDVRRRRCRGITSPSRAGALARRARWRRGSAGR